MSPRPTRPDARRSTTAARRPLRPIARAGWAAMLALHLWPLGKVALGIAAGEGGWVGLGALLATQALFAAKALDVRWLRLPSRSAAVVAFVLATCLAHPEVAFEELGHATKGAAVATLAVAPAAIRTRPRRWLQHLRDLLGRASHRTTLWRDRVGALASACHALVVARVCLSSAAGRAPPRSVLA